MASTQSNAPLFKAGLVSFLITVVVDAIGLVSFLVLMLAMNGFSGRAAMPFFMAWLFTVCMANLGLCTLVGGLLLKTWSSGPRRWTASLVIAAVLSVPPLLLGAAVLLFA